MKDNDKKEMAKSIIDITASIGEAAFSLVTPVTAVTAAGVIGLIKFVLFNISDNHAKKHIKKQEIQNFKSNLENLMLTCSALNNVSDTAKKFRYIEISLNTFKSLEENEFTDISLDSLNSLNSKVIKYVKKVIPDSPNTQPIISSIVVYTITQLLYIIQPAEKIKNFQINSSIEFSKNIDILNERVSVIERNADASFISNQKINDIINACTNAFTETLYLHKDNRFITLNEEKRVSLKNLYVFPKIKKTFDDNNNKELRIDTFLASTQFKNMIGPFILLGDAGSGKTTITEWLAYNYTTSKNAHDDIFHNKELIIVRLRYVRKDLIGKLKIFHAICDHLGLDHNNDPFYDKFVILDGLDEIYSPCDNTDFTDVLKNIKQYFKYAYKLIITSRTNILSFVSPENDQNIYSIMPFDYEQKKEWMEKYETLTPSIISPSIKEYILNKESIFDYPQLIYMIASADTSENDWSLDNKWSIYNHIFFTNIFDRNYEQDSEVTPSEKEKNIIYYIIQVIAYEMYKQNSISKIDRLDNEAILKQLKIPNITSAEIESAFNSYGYKLGCYWKIHENATELEFYHNNIRDFFIAEYLYTNLNSIFSEIVTPEDFANYHKTQNEIQGYNQYESISKKLYHLLNGVFISKEVIEFIALRANYEKANPKDKCHFINFIFNNILYTSDQRNEKNDKNTLPIDNFINELCTNLNIYNDYDNSQTIHSLIKISNFLNNFLTIIHEVSYENNNALRPLFNHKCIDKICSVYINTRSLRYINLSRSYFKGANFSYARLCKAILIDTNFVEANLINADLEGAILRNADLSEAELCGANFSYSDLSGANLQDASCGEMNLTEANLENSNMKFADFTYSNLSSANLSCSNMKKTYFTNANLTGASIHDSNLSDASFISTNLEEADLRRCKINNANFFEAYLFKSILVSNTICDADFRQTTIKKATIKNSFIKNVDLSRSNLYEATIHDTKLIDVNMNEAILQYAIISDSKLSNIDMINSDLRGAIFENIDLSTANMTDADIRDTQFINCIYDSERIKKSRNWNLAKFINN